MAAIREGPGKISRFERIRAHTHIKGLGLRARMLHEMLNKKLEQIEERYGQKLNNVKAFELGLQLEHSMIQQN